MECWESAQCPSPGCVSRPLYSGYFNPLQASAHRAVPYSEIFPPQASLWNLGSTQRACGSDRGNLSTIFEIMRRTERPGKVVFVCLACTASSLTLDVEDDF